MIKIIVDTDIGDDIDDALALVLGFNHPDIQILGITTVFRDAGKRANLTELLLADYGKKDIIVARGLSQPLRETVGTDAAQFRILPDCGLPYREYKDAIDYIVETMRADKEVKLVGIAALTNIAEAIQRAPEHFRSRDLYLMGGMYGFSYPEWNIRWDPEAADIVFGSGMNIHAVGLDVTLKTELTEAEYMRLKEIIRKRGGVIRKMLDIWEEGAEYRPILHDVLTMAGLVEPSILQYERADIAIELTGTFTRGLTFNRKNVFPVQETITGNCYAAVQMDREKFMEVFFKYFN